MGENTQIETMKKIVASVGLFAVGASGVHAATAAALSGESAKPWSVSATLRGFYDDNVGTAPNGSPKVDTFGYQVSPGLNLNWSGEQTTLTLGYLYTFLYYENRPPGNSKKYDQTHQFNALLNHAFSERYVLSVADSFVIGQEPDLLRAGNIFSTYQRIPGDNIRNDGQIKLAAQITPVFGTELGYENAVFHYADHTANYTTNTPPLFQSASQAGVLDRLEHYFHVDGRWQVQPETIGIVGYRYARKDYTGGEVISAPPLTAAVYHSDSRNFDSHYGYIGADHIFRPDFSGSLRIGASYNDYYNEPGSPTEVNPYVQASLQYTYLQDCYFSLGLTVDQNATDAFSAQNGSITTSAQSETIYGSVNHRIMPRIYGSVIAQFQNSSLHGGAYDNVNERYFLVGLNLEYRFNPHLSANAGYNYDKLDSDLPNRGFDRNRVYLGVTASY